MGKRYIIVVEDSEMFLECIKETFDLCCEKYGAPNSEYKAFTNITDANNFIEVNRNIAALLTDVQLENDDSGMELATNFVHSVPNAPVFIMTRAIPTKKIYPIMSNPRVKHAKKPLSAEAIEKIFREALYS